jgi:hypothetical protein
MTKFRQSPEGWDPATVLLTLPPPLSGSETETERLEIIKLHNWVVVDR